MVKVHEDCGLFVFYPEYDDIRFQVGRVPDISDTTIIMCCSAAFTEGHQFRPDYSDVAGPYVSDGVYHDGYPCIYNTSAFVYYDSQWLFAVDSVRYYLGEAVRSGGMAFSQIPILYGQSSDTGPEDVYFSIGKFRCYKSRDGKILFRNRNHKYRALCEKDGILCLVQAKDSCSYSEFLERLKVYGVERGIYLDVGSGWSYGWYRIDGNNVQKIGEFLHPFISNWLVFRNVGEH